MCSFLLIVSLWFGGSTGDILNCFCFVVGFSDIIPKQMIMKPISYIRKYVDICCICVKSAKSSKGRQHISKSYMFFFTYETLHRLITNEYQTQWQATRSSINCYSATCSTTWILLKKYANKIFKRRNNLFF